MQEEEVGWIKAVRLILVRCGVVINDILERKRILPVFCISIILTFSEVFISSYCLLIDNGAIILALVAIFEIYAVIVYTYA